MMRAAIIGLGTMGPGIAATLAHAGLSVSAFDTSQTQREKAPMGFRIASEILGKLEVPDKSRTRAIAVAGSLGECVAGADFVLENVSEKLELKAAIFREIEAMVSSACVLASDTSGIPITKIQEGLSHPGRVIGMHWSNPPHIIPMIEVIAGKQTAPATTEWMSDLVRRIGHIPVLVKKDVPGFVENRILYAVMRECLDLVEDGVIDPEQMDTCVSWGIGYKLAVIGPMALLDMAGLDIYQAVAVYLNKELSRRQDVTPLVGQRVAAGKLGIKTGSGIYEYTPRRIQELQVLRAGQLVALRKALMA